MPKIPVTYQCWGCGAEVTVLEETAENVPSLTKWNVCPDCLKKKELGNRPDTTV